MDIEVVPPGPQRVAIKQRKSRYWLLVAVAVIVSLTMVGGALTWRWWQSNGQKSTSVSDNVIKEKTLSNASDSESPTSMTTDPSSSTSSGNLSKKMRADEISSQSLKDRLENSKYPIFEDILSQSTLYSFVSFNASESAITVEDKAGAQSMLRVLPSAKLYSVTEYSIDESGNLVGFSYGNPLSLGNLVNISTKSSVAIAFAETLSSEGSTRSVKTIVVFKYKS